MSNNAASPDLPVSDSRGDSLNQIAKCEDQSVVLQDQYVDYLDRANAAELTSVCPWSDEGSCIEMLFHARWPDGFRCPDCKHTECYIISSRRLPLYDCKKCGKQTSLTSGTVFHGSTTPLLKWFQAIYLNSREQGISALRLSRAISVTYKTAWLIAHKLRKVMSQDVSEERLEGDVFVTDLIVYHKRFVSDELWQSGEQCVLAGGVLDEEGDVVQVRVKQVPKELAPIRDCVPDIRQFQHDCISRESLATLVYVSRYQRERRYPTQWPKPKGDEKKRIDRTDFSRRKKLEGIVHGAERWLALTFNGIGDKHLQAYLDQYFYVWYRWGEAIAEPFMQLCTASKAITYPELTGTFSKRLRNLTGREQPKVQPAVHPTAV